MQRQSTTTVTGIEDAIDECGNYSLSGEIPWQKIADKHGVVRSTLTRRHMNMTRSRADRALEQRAISIKQELELVVYIKRLTERYLPPTRTMIKNFASEIAKKEVSESWVTRFMNRNKAQITSQLSEDTERIQCDAVFGETCELYLDMMQRKVDEHGIKCKHIYYMDEKGIAVGAVERSKRMFSKKLYETTKTSEYSLQEGKRKWVTLLGCTCEDGSVLPPSLVYQNDTKSTQSAWLSEKEAQGNSTFSYTSSSGWINDAVGLAWLEQVFNRFTEQKAQGEPRLLVVDGHGSYLTINFIRVCDANNIELAVLPRSTHPLQLLDAVCFNPLATNYSNELTEHLQKTERATPLSNRVFSKLFWKAWKSTFVKESILDSSEDTSLTIPYPSKMRRMSTNNNLSDGPGTSEYRRLKHLVRCAMKGGSRMDVRALWQYVHHIFVQNTILRIEIARAREALSTETNDEEKGKLLQLEHRQEWHGKAMWWSKESLEAGFCQNTAERTKRGGLKATVKQYDAHHKGAEGKVVTERATENERTPKARGAAKPLQLSQTDKMKAPEPSEQKNKRQKYVNVAVGGAEDAEVPLVAPIVTTRHGRQVRLPTKYRQDNIVI